MTLDDDDVCILEQRWWRLEYWNWFFFLWCANWPKKNCFTLFLPVFDDSFQHTHITSKTNISIKINNNNNNGSTWKKKNSWHSYHILRKYKMVALLLLLLFFFAFGFYMTIDDPLNFLFFFCIDFLKNFFCGFKKKKYCRLF